MNDHQETSTHDQGDHSASQWQVATELSQEDLQARYHEQQRRMSCPGCGEAFELF